MDGVRSLLSLSATQPSGYTSAQWARTSSHVLLSIKATIDRAYKLCHRPVATRPGTIRQVQIKAYPCRCARRHGSPQCLVSLGGWGSLPGATVSLSRKAHAVAHREGLVTNPKRARRVWRDEGSLQRLPERKAKRRRLSDGSAARLRASCPNELWRLDFCFDETADLRRIKLLNVVDEFTREALAVNAAYRIGSDGVVAAVERLVVDRGAPAHLRMDNGPELTAATLRHWCRIWSTHTAYIELGSRWETPFVESFNGHLRDECLNVEDFRQPHRSQDRPRELAPRIQPLPAPPILAGLTPVAYAAYWHQHQPEHP